jgi:hypothetical protein
VYKELNVIILDYIKTHNNKLSKNLKNFYNSVIKMNPKPYSRKIAKNYEKIVNNFIVENNPWNLLAYINSDEMIAYRAPFKWSLNPDDKEPDIFRCYIDPHTFALVDLSIYYDDQIDIKYREKYKKKFINTIQKVFDISLGKNNYKAQDVFDVGVDIFNALGCVSVTSKEENTYNKVYADEAFKKYGFDWHTFSKELGFKKTPEFFITSSLNYLKCGSELLIKNWINEINEDNVSNYDLLFQKACWCKTMLCDKCNYDNSDNCNC